MRALKQHPRRDYLRPPPTLHRFGTESTVQRPVLRTSSGVKPQERLSSHLNCFSSDCLRSNVLANECSTRKARETRPRSLAMPENRFFRAKADRRQLWWLIRFLAVGAIEFLIHSASCCRRPSSAQWPQLPQPPTAALGLLRI